MPRIICKNCDENKKHYANGLCQRCWLYQWRSENPEKVKEYRRRHYEKYREKILAANRRWVDEHREEYREYKNQYNWEHREEHQTYVKNWYQENRGEVLERSRQWAKRNPERYAANQKRWREENSERKRALKVRREARKQGLPSTLTEKQRERLFAVAHVTYPGEKLHLDHIVPISKGGGTTFANVHYIPAPLNLFKRDKLPEEVYKQLELW